ncbi:MAG: hypothetical protein JW769_00655 [Parachlamydiales bacterium]|nr:hypothetical protein [Parachlamydiales bacterium]
MGKWFAALCVAMSLSANNVEQSFLSALNSDYKWDQENRDRGQVWLYQQKLSRVMHHPYRIKTLKKILYRLAETKKNYLREIKDCIRYASSEEVQRVLQSVEESKIAMTSNEKAVLTALLMFGLFEGIESSDIARMRQIYTEYFIKKKMVEQYSDFSQQASFFQENLCYWQNTNQLLVTDVAKEVYEALEQEKMKRIREIIKESNDSYLEKLARLHYSTIEEMFTAFYLPLFFVREEYLHFMPQNNVEQRAVALWRKYGHAFASLLKELEEWKVKHEKRLQISG